MHVPENHISLATFQMDYPVTPSSSFQGIEVSFGAVVVGSAGAEQSSSSTHRRPLLLMFMLML